MSPPAAVSPFRQASGMGLKPVLLELYATWCIEASVLNCSCKKPQLCFFQHDRALPIENIYFYNSTPYENLRVARELLFTCSVCVK